jgi:hypothetical protein
MNTPGIRNPLPRGGGGEYQSMSFGEKILNIGKEKGGKCKRKRKKGARGKKKRGRKKRKC